MQRWGKQAGLLMTVSLISSLSITEQVVNPNPQNLHVIPRRPSRHPTWFLDTPGGNLTLPGFRVG